MRIYFECETNKGYVAINTLEITLPTGTTITVDRDTTEYDLNGDMVWKSCYLWAIDGHNIFGDGYRFKNSSDVKDFKELIKEATLEFTYDEDVADEDYKVTIKEISITV